MGLFKEKARIFSFLIEDMLWYKSAGEIEWNDISEPISKTMQTAMQEHRFKVLIEENKEAKKKYFE